VFQKKFDSEGKISRYEARLAAHGHKQEAIRDLSSPLIFMEALRLVLSMAAAEDWDISQWDAETAFLPGSKLKKSTYCRRGSTSQTIFSHQTHGDDIRDFWKQ
jgi:hypothetical protein